MVRATFPLNSDFNSSGGPREFGEDPSIPKIEKKCILFSSIFNVEGPCQRYLPKKTLEMHGWVKITPLQNAKRLFSQNPIVKNFIW